MRNLEKVIWSVGVIMLIAAVPGARAAAKDAGTIVIVFKDGSQQTFRLADIARIDFNASTSSADTNTLVPGRAHFLGEWKVGDGAGGTFVITLNADGKAHKTKGSGGGTWTVVDREAHIAWDDGWHDAIRKVGGKYEKAAYSPGTSFSDRPSNVASAERKAEPN